MAALSRWEWSDPRVEFDGLDISQTVTNRDRGYGADGGNQFANNVVFTFVSERVRMNARTRWVLKGSTMSRPSELEANSSFAVLMVDVRRSIDFENSVAFTAVVQVL